MKKLLSLLLCALLIALPLSVNAESASNGPVQIENGATLDLDGDGTDEPIAFAEERDEYGDGKFTLTVGSSTVSQENCISLGGELYAFSLTHPGSDTPWGTLLMPFEYGPSDDPVSYCYLYTDGTLYSIGTIEALPTSMNLNGELIETTVRCDILGTWGRAAAYKIAYGYSMNGEEYVSTYAICEIPRDIYPMGLIAETKIDLPLQASRTDDTVSGTIAAGEKIVFAATDNLHWVYATSLDGTVSGWFYGDYSDYPATIRVSGKTVNADDAFADLMYAD